MKYSLIFLVFALILSCKNSSQENQNHVNDAIDSTKPKSLESPHVHDTSDNKGNLIVQRPVVYQKHARKLGSEGCIPNSNLILTSNSLFHHIITNEKEDGTTKTYYYLPFDTAYIHKSTGVVETLTQVFYRSTSPDTVINWNKAILDCQRDKPIGVGICPSNTIFHRNDFNMLYFTEGALFCGEELIRGNSNCRKS